MNIKVPLQKSDSVLVSKFNSNKESVLFDYQSSVSREAASLSKIFLALETIDRLDKKDIENKVINIKKSDLAGYGTDILSDLFSRQSKLDLDTLTLVGLMIKYSCNSSAAILANNIILPRTELEKRAFDYWKLKNVRLVNKNNGVENQFSLHDIYIVYNNIFAKRGPMWGFLREKLRTSRNIFYLFDQIELQILASKSGTVFKDGHYWISDTGIIRVNDQNYFLGAIVKRNNISTAVKNIREIGRSIVAQI